MSRRFRLPKDRIAALAADWGLLLLLSYCVYYLTNYWFRALHRVAPGYRVPFPGYAYAVTIVSTFVLAMLWENLGTSIGWKGVGLAQADREYRSLGLGRRTLHLLADLASWGMTGLSAGFALVPVAGLGTLLYGIASRTGVSIVPTLTFWPIGPWPATLGLTLLMAAALAAVGALCWWVAGGLWGWLWPRTKGAPAWVERVSRSLVCRASDLRDSRPPRRWWQTSWGLVTLLIVVMTIYVGALTSEISIHTMIQRAAIPGAYWAKLLSPDFTYFLTPEPDLRDTMLNAAIVSIFMALVATLFGFVFAFPLSFLGARNMVTKNRLGWAVYTVVRGAFNVGRSIEPFVMALFFAFWIKFGPFAGALALFFHTVAALGKLFSEQVEAIDPGPVEAIVASGGSRLQVLRYGVMPQVVPPFLAFTLYRWDINVRMSTIIGIVAGCGLGRFFNYFKNELRWHEVGAVLVIIAVVVISMDYISGRVRERIT